MTTIVDPELTVRLGALDRIETERIQDYATAAFLWRGLRQADALDVARGLHWRAVGLDLAAPAELVVGALALEPPAADDHARLAELLDRHDALDNGPPVPLPERPGPGDFRRLGRRLSLALMVLATHERAVT